MIRVRTAYRYRIYPSQAQTLALDGQLAEARRLYNACLQERRDCYRATGKTPSSVPPLPTVMMGSRRGLIEGLSPAPSALQAVGHQRERPEANPSRVEDGVSQRRGDGDDRGLSGSRRRKVLPVDEDGLDDRNVAEAGDAVT